MLSVQLTLSGVSPLGSNPTRNTSWARPFFWSPKTQWIWSPDECATSFKKPNKLPHHKMKTFRNSQGLRQKENIRRAPVPLFSPNISSVPDPAWPPTTSGPSFIILRSNWSPWAESLHVQRRNPLETSLKALWVQSHHSNFSLCEDGGRVWQEILSPVIHLEHKYLWKPKAHNEFKPLKMIHLLFFSNMLF